MERETRIELATNSLEGCDSTIELLPRLFLFYTAKVEIPMSAAPSCGARSPPLACVFKDRYDALPRRSYDQNQHGLRSPWRYSRRSRSEYIRVSRGRRPAGASVECRYERARQKRRGYRQPDRGF